jgi:hypothetical protein
MKPALICFAFILLVGVIGCNREHEKIINAPRTESASSVGGWTDVSTSGIALRFPNDWKAIDLTTGDLEQIDRVFGSDPKFAEMRSRIRDAALQGTYKLMVFETATLGSGFATNCNVAMVDRPGEETLEQAVDENLRDLSLRGSYDYAAAERRICVVEIR